LTTGENLRIAELSHWDYPVQFSGFDAAALILGLDPHRSVADQSQIQVVCDRMKHHYTHALKRHYYNVFSIYPEDFQVVEAGQPFELESVTMEMLCPPPHLDVEDPPFTDWLISERSNFEMQIFSRVTMASWVDALRLNSKYSFSLDRTSANSEQKGHWPWGAHHTQNLEHLEAAARRFWVGYDPDEISTANTNATVIDWLKTERKVSGKMAEAIATMLRADGLPTGPRK